jgi:hypothetical protein
VIHALLHGGEWLCAEDKEITVEQISIGGIIYSCSGAYLIAGTGLEQQSINVTMLLF